MLEARLPVTRSAPGRLDLGLDAQERRILGSLVAELRGELADPAASAPDGTLARLFPPAFPDDPEAEAAYADLVHEDLAETRRDRLAVVEATLDARSLDDRQAAAWLATLNDLRLVLGASLGVTEDDDEALPDADAPDGVRRAVFGWLGWLVSAFVEAMAATLPEVPDEAD